MQTAGRHWLASLFYYDEWVRKLKSAENVTEEFKTNFIGELDGTRHVMIVDMRQFFSDAVASNQLDASEPIAIITKGYPFAMLDCYSDVECVTRFCESAGLSYEIHVYPSTSISTQVH